MSSDCDLKKNRAFSFSKYPLQNILIVLDFFSPQLVFKLEACYNRSHMPKLAPL